MIGQRDLARGIACAGLLGVLIGSAPARAGRPIVIDQPPLLDITPCALGSQNCTGFDLSALGGPFGTIYVYAEGIVSLDHRLASTATTNGLAGLVGSGNWFAPGFTDEQYQVRGLYSQTPNGKAFVVNFYAAGVEIIPQTDEDDPGGGGEGTEPLFQFQMLPTAPGYAVTLFGFGYGSGPAPDSLIGFSLDGVSDAVTYNNGLRVGAGSEDSDFAVSYGPSGAITDQFELHYVPEPAVWTMLIPGFGLLGAALRSVRRRPLPV